MNRILPSRWPYRSIVAVASLAACRLVTGQVTPSLVWRGPDQAVLPEPGVAKACFPTISGVPTRDLPVRGTDNAVAAGSGNSLFLVLKADGTVKAFLSRSYSDWSQANGELVPSLTRAPPSDWQNVRAIACGSSHRLALKADGTVSVWWDRGVTGFENTLVPAGLNNVIAIAASSTHSMALRADGTVVSWGWDPAGIQKGYPLDVPASLHDATAIAAGSNFSMALLRNGRVMLWGFKPPGFPYVPADVIDAVAISASDSLALAQFRDGSFETWRNSNYPLDTVSSRYRGTRYSIGGMQDVSLRGTRIYAQTSTGDLAGNLTSSYGNQWRTTPVPVQELNDVNAFAPCPNNDPMQLCIRQSLARVEFPLTNAGEQTRRTVAVANTSAASVTLSSVRFAGQHATDFAVLETLPLTVNPGGTGTLTFVYSPHQTGGSLSICTIASNDPGRPVQTIRCTGASTAPQLAVEQGPGLLESGPSTIVAWPAPSSSGVQIPSRLRDAKAVAAGVFFGIVVRADGSAISLGRSSSSNLQGLTATDVPPGVEGLARVLVNPDSSPDIAYGWRSDGTLTSWPDSSFSSPALADFAVGTSHQVGVTLDGKVMGWGSNTFGQLDIPAGLLLIQSVAAGRFSSAALREDGRIIFWPLGRFAKLSWNLMVPGASKIFEVPGDFLYVLKADGSVLTTDFVGSVLDQSLHPLTGAISDVQDLSVGSSHRFAIKRDGTLVSFGPGTADRAVPAGLNGVTSASGSIALGMAMREGVGFGYVAAGAAQDMMITLRNNGDGALTPIHCEITGDAANDFSVQSAPPSTLAPDESGDVIVRFQPRLGGKRKATLKIWSNTPDPAESPFIVPLWGLGKSFTAKRSGGSFTASALRLDRQTGMLLQTVSYRNDTDADLPNGVTLRIGNLPAKVIVVSSSYGGQPATFDVLYTNPILAGEAITITLVYFDPLRRTKTQPSVSILSLLEPVPQPGPIAGTLVILRSVRASAQGPLIEFDATPGFLHVVEYSDDDQKTWHAAVHRLTGGSRIFWVDRGQPETQTAPKGVPQNPGGRLYRVKRL